MGEAKRRKLLAAKNNAIAIQHAPMFPDDLKADIAKMVRLVDLDLYDAGKRVVVDGGLCTWRAWVGCTALRQLGIATAIVFGGLLYRVGPDDERDIIRFAGPGNVGCATADGLFGHCWLECGDDFIDFAAGDWRAMTPDDEDVIGPIMWQIDPPQFVWQPQTSLRREPGQITPELGQIWYTGWQGCQPDMREWFGKYQPLLPTITAHVDECCRRAALRQRIWAARNGVVVLRLA